MLKIAGNGWKELEWHGMDCKGLKGLEIAVKGWNGWNWLEMAGMDGNGVKLLEMAGNG